MVIIFYINTFSILMPNYYLNNLDVFGKLEACNVENWEYNWNFI